MRELSWIGEIGLSGFLDILFMWFVIYALLVWSKKTRAASVLTGILIVAGVYLLTRQLNMILAAGLLEKFFAIILIALVVIFQEELRYFFEQIAVWSFHRRLGSKTRHALTREEIDILVRTLTDLAKEKIGALIVIRGKDLIIRHLDGGIHLRGSISEPLLKSLFDPSSIGHDGAVYIEGNTVVQFSCHLPLSKNSKKIGKGGTRHAAALGLAELCDALCLVVSEERGTISIGRNGNLKVLSGPDELRLTIQKFYDEAYPKVKTNPWEGFLKKNFREKVFGLLLACAVWFVLVFGAKYTYKTFIVPVSHQPMPSPWVMKQIKPDKVYLTLGGPRNAFFLLASNKISLLVNPELKKGNQKVRIYPTDIQFPEVLTLEVLAPQEIEFQIEEVSHEPVNSGKPQSGLLAKVKDVIPLIHNGQESVPEKETGVTELVPSDTKASTKLKVEKVQHLEDAKPEDVVKYLEQKVEGNVVIESSKPENQNNP